MTSDAHGSGLQLRSRVGKSGTLELSLATIDTPEPREDDVVVRIEGSPINPSDLGLLFGGADLSTAEMTGTSERPVLTATVPEATMKALSARLDKSLPVGSEGAGVVVRTGSSPAARALLGRTVAIWGGAMYTQYRTLDISECLLLPEGTTAAEGASCFINPLTALGMVETMRMEGHSALVHTAAASNVGQMLNKLCIKDGIALVNIVRKPDHVELLKSLGATYVCNLMAPTFIEDLTEALVATGATLAFDAIGGGKRVGHILQAMEAAATRRASAAKQFTRYGSTTHKQVYIYGNLNSGPTEFYRNFGMAWGIGGWLLNHFLSKVGPDAAQTLKERVASEIKTTFASKYTKEVSLAEALTLEELAVYTRQATGRKYLINPNKGRS